MWLVGELGLEHRRLDIGGEFGGTGTADFLAKNPMGLIPVIEDGDFVLFESQSIVRYLGLRYGEGSPVASLWSGDIFSRAVVDQWMEWVKTSVAPVFTYKVFWQLVRTSAAERDGGLVSGGVEELAVRMGIAEARLSLHAWLVGDEMTLADISFGSLLYRYFTVDFARGDYPCLRSYYDRLCLRGAYAEHVMVSYDSLRAPDA